MNFWPSRSELDEKMAAEASIAAEALADGHLKALWQAESKKPKDKRNLDVLFQYAMLLCMSAGKRDNRTGVGMLKELIVAGYPNAEDCLYTAAMGLRRLGDYDGARAQVEKLLRVSPDHRAGLALHAELKKDVARRDTTTGVAAAVGFGVAGVVLAAVLARKK